jgi:hypothetical protein
MNIKDLVVLFYKIYLIRYNIKMSEKHEKLIDDEEEIIKFADDKSVSEIEPNFIVRQNRIEIFEKNQNYKKSCCIVL